MSTAPAPAITSDEIILKIEALLVGIDTSKHVDISELIKYICDSEFRTHAENLRKLNPTKYGHFTKKIDELWANNPNERK